MGGGGATRFLVELRKYLKVLSGLLRLNSCSVAMETRQDAAVVEENCS